jgi:hypothetical protein
MNYPKDLVKSLSLIDKWEFNVFDVSDASKQRPLTYVLYELLKKYDLLSTFKVRLFKNTIYAKNPNRKVVYWRQNKSCLS